MIINPTLLLGTSAIHLGARIQIRDGARLETISARLDRTFSPHVEIGDDTSIEQGFHLTCAERITIGAKVAITQYVGIFDIWHDYLNAKAPIVDQPLKTAPVSIGDHCLIGMGAVIQPGVSIGCHCIIGANAVVTKSIPDHCVAVGAPARIIKHYDANASKWLSGPP